jgi:hypothetical protein
MPTERFAGARLSGDLPGTVDPRDAARYLLALTEGIAVQAAYGADRTDLETARRAGPDPAALGAGSGA